MTSKLSISYLNLLYAICYANIECNWCLGVKASDPFAMLSSTASRSSFLEWPADCLNSVLWFPNPIGNLILYAVRTEPATAQIRHYPKSIEDVRMFQVNIPVIKNLTCLPDPSRSRMTSSCVSEKSCECLNSGTPDRLLY